MTQSRTQDSTADHKVDIFMPIFIGDYLKDTNRLSAAEHGAYLLLLFDYWQNGSLPDNDTVLCRISRMTAEEWANSKDTVKSFFKSKNGRLHHSRVERELAAAKEKKANFSERGKKGNEVRWGKDKNPLAIPSRSPLAIPLATKEGVPNLSPSPSPSPSYSESSSNTTAAKIVADASFLDEHPEYAKLANCATFSKITPERYLNIKRNFRDRDAITAVEDAVLCADSPDEEIKLPDKFLISKFKFAPDLDKFEIPYAHGGYKLRKNADGSWNEADEAARHKAVC